ncbi:MAG: NUDIX domain-containing protein [Cyanobacteria bacterium J06600_6]
MNDSERVGLIPVTMAIIYQDGKYLMQLRDDIPTILYPGVWGLFGGHIEPGEAPETGLRRELIEEINYSPSSLTKFRSIFGDKYLRHFFHCPLSVSVSELELREGWDLKLLTPQEIETGAAYSEQAGAKKQLGEMHRQIMLDFIATVKRN